MKNNKLNRRDFIQKSVLASAVTGVGSKSLFFHDNAVPIEGKYINPLRGEYPSLTALHLKSDSPALTFGVDELNAIRWGADDSSKWKPYTADLAPAKWIWLPVERTLPNTFALFRKMITLDALPKSAHGWITADSRYRLTVNGRHVQWGIAPSDPRTPDVDPVDLAPYLQKGQNVIGIEVLHFGHGDGTWADGRPGLLAHFVLEDSTGNKTRIVTDNSWQALLDRAHPPGHYKRWFLRALQEEFDSRLRPDGWDAPGFKPDALWTSADELAARADKPVVTGKPVGLEGDKLQVPSSLAALHTRQIPLTKEVWQPAAEMTEQGRVRWKRPVDDWFDVRMADSFSIEREPVAQQTGAGVWTLPANAKGEGWFLTFSLPMLMVGWPAFEIEAPAGTVIELMVQEGHDPKGPQPWLETFFHSWTRFISKGGKQRFQTFDYESACWVQLHIHEATGPVKISGVGMTRRLFDWPREPVMKFAEPALDRLFAAAINRTKNNQIETVVDCVGRERQQYSGDQDFQHLTTLYAFGETRLLDRFLRTWTQGQMKSGCFFDAWPAYDRLLRIAQRELNGTLYGPLAEYGLHCFVSAREFQRYTGSLDNARDIYPRFQRYVEFLRTLRGSDGLLFSGEERVEHFYSSQAAHRELIDHKCAFTIRAIWGLKEGLIPLAEALGKTEDALAYRQLANELLASAKAHFWSAEVGAFVNNLPRLKEEKTPVMDELTLTFSVWAGLCPEGRIDATLDLLERMPKTVKSAVPWYLTPRMTLLARHGRSGVVLKELREVWAQIPPVTGPTLTVSEAVMPKGDAPYIFSHSGTVLYDVLLFGLLGFEPAEEPGGLFRLQPQLGDFQGLETDIHTARGPIHFKSYFKDGVQHITIFPPAGLKLNVNIPTNATSESGPLGAGTVKGGWREIPITAGKETRFRLSSK